MLREYATTVLHNEDSVIWLFCFLCEFVKEVLDLHCMRY